MSKGVAIMSMSLDGYVADLSDGVAEVFGWSFTSGDVEIRTGGSAPMTFSVSGPSAETTVGAVGRLEPRPSQSPNHHGGACGVGDRAGAAPAARCYPAPR